jgi:branched-chain amino acid transport system substrate-binding protein
MVEAVEAAGETPDLFTPDGFVAGQMIVRAVAEGDGDVDAMIGALEGWTFDGPKGEYTIRESDHALIQDMYTASLVADGDTWKPELIEVIPGADVAPPEASAE